MSDLIDREQAIDSICINICGKSHDNCGFWKKDFEYCTACRFAFLVGNTPSAEAEMPDRWLFINEKNEPKFWQYNIRNGQISPITDLEDTSITWRVGMPFEEITGHWENIDVIHDRKDAKITDWQQAQCSVCRKWHTKPYLYGIDLDPYCPSCGARMVNDENL